ncbi:class F sortase [Streptomyces aurantiogriseus]|uniref:Class F sortase n=1 Tax=Streptomyces aurantiogriseus TaxID=66870 RepID=A0A918FP74_9ACTN|nr:class F sortase [Streptomyces aurantiogriseus]GGR62752.1 class F sortase [Streptomyces aurantiogriseus]
MAVPPSAPTDDEPVPPGQGSRGTTTILCAAALLLLALSLLGGHDTSSRPADASRPPHAPQAAPVASPLSGRPVGKHLPRSRPVRLIIPKISVNAPFTDLDLASTGHLEAPPPNDTNLVGWHAAGPSPGETGTSIIAGHVDTATSAAVFAELSELKKGDVFHVTRADGRKASFVVDDTETFDKDHFPSARVYADTRQAQVRLITCAGDYDRAVKDYTANLVVFAHLR